MIYYVYQLVDPRTGKPFYVGKGKDRRAWSHATAVKAGRPTGNPQKEKRIADIHAAGLDVEVEIVERFDDESAAYAHELSLIREGLADLTNIMVGWEPRAGHVPQARPSARPRDLGPIKRWADENAIYVGIWNLWDKGKTVPGILLGTPPDRGYRDLLANVVAVTDWRIAEAEGRTDVPCPDLAPFEVDLSPLPLPFKHLSWQDKVVCE